MGGCVCLFVYTHVREDCLHKAVLKYESYLKISVFEDDCFRQKLCTSWVMAP